MDRMNVSNGRLMIARIAPSEAERRAGAFGLETLEHALRCVRVEGALILEDIVDTAVIAEAKRAFFKVYARYLNNSKHDDALSVGDRRVMITVNLEPPFDDPRLFANPWLLPVLSAALDEEFVLGAFGVVCSLSFAPGQERHRDGGVLFPHSNVERLLPAVAITVAIPLLEMNELHGTTALWLGSHRSEGRVSIEGDIQPVVREGSCVLWDYRLVHGGTPNRSTLPRPLLYMMYCRPWFVDQSNFKKQAPLRACMHLLTKLSERQQRLLARAQGG